ncbi:hypothetical protein A2477_04375 [Candidatus Falkowbacteria bacterium RIFOXYC2_FULL_47_12]|uniref:Bacterial bifunctional deaminase-reductase C-terminal domain-containing protein n=2 Tax=Candidatus Falkowiibacteriota TaxID=1752728 RepID=A0A1F5TLD2_9BACT|nr:MAG: hypothetical protein A2242_02115 [Candidatus Falkowbacteria bacterium RIFOXYA2_FULL_47_9]OGF39728.1 MAG: hypothetical protein A2477_04375 [Candidatus Falkowbacteria bacterium RIFOXYC2_FULL_47_12]
MIAAITIDGRIAKDSHQLTDWTSVEDKNFLHKKLDASDVVIVGNNTFKTAREPLSKRNCIVFTRAIAGSRQKNENCLYVNPAGVDIIKLLQGKNYRRIAVLGGTQVYSWFLEKNLLDEIYLTVEPIVFGSGLPLFTAGLTRDTQYKLISAKKLNNKGSVLLHYVN